MTTSPSLPAPVMPGTAAYRRIGVALFLAGFSTFALLYCAQPLLPVFADYFQVGAAEARWPCRSPPSRWPAPSCAPPPCPKVSAGAK